MRGGELDGDKNSILFNNAVAPHFNYVGDSVLGYKAHLGAGVKISNFKLMPGNIGIELDGKAIDTGLRNSARSWGPAEVGATQFLNPGSIIGRDSSRLCQHQLRGYLPE